MYDFSISTLFMFSEFLNAFQIPAGHQQIVELAQQTELARRELQAAVEKAQEVAAVAALTAEDVVADA